MRHRDSRGNDGHLVGGSVQAGRDFQERRLG
jgi:hypothetical protein